MSNKEQFFEQIKVKVFGTTDIKYTLENMLLILTGFYKAKPINIEQLKDYSLGYPDSFSTIEEYSEGLITSKDDYMIVLIDASTENQFLDDRYRKYDLIIISSTNNKIIKIFRRIESEDRSLEYVIDQFDKQV